MSENKLIYDIELFFRNKCENNQQEFVIDCEKVAHKNLVMDELRVKQILNNLLTNAVKYNTYQGTVILSVKIDFFVKKCKFRPIISLRLPVFLSLFAVRNVKRNVKKLLT